MKRHQELSPNDPRTLVVRLANDISKKELHGLDSPLDFSHFDRPSVDREPEMKEVISF